MSVLAEVERVLEAILGAAGEPEVKAA